MTVPALLAPVQRLLADERRRHSTDRELLRAFVQEQDQRAFAELLRRHGPMILRLALHLVRQRQDAEDVFQATFLTLAQKAHSLRDEASVAAWLHRVAWRLAVRSRQTTQRRKECPPLSLPTEQADVAEEISLREARALLHEELAALPERWREPLVLCYLQELTRDEAARRLGWSLGTLKRRLEEGRKLLHARLSRRGVSLSAVLATSLLGAANVSASLLVVTQRLAMPGGTAAIPAAVAALAAHGSMVKWKTVWALLLMVGVGAGAGAWVSGEPAAAEKAPIPARTPQAAKTDATPLRQGEASEDPLPEGAFARLGNLRFRHSDRVECLAFSPDGKTLASGGEDAVLRIWDVPSGRQLRASPRLGNYVAALAYSPDGRTLAVRSSDTIKPGISLIDAATFKEQRFVSLGHNNQPFLLAGNTVAFSPDGKSLAAGKPTGEICLFDPSNGKELAALGQHQHNNVYRLAFSPDGRTVVSCAQDKTIRLWDVAERKQRFVLRSEDTDVGPVVFARGGKWLISGGGTRKEPDKWDSPWAEPAIRIWDTATGKQLRVFKDDAVRAAVSSLALAPDGRTLAASYKDKLRLWDITTGKIVKSLSGPRNIYWPVSQLRFSPDGKLLAGRIGNTIALWDTASGRLLNLADNESASGIDTVAVSGKGHLLATGDHDGFLALWDMRTRRQLRHFHAHTTAIRKIAFAPDDRTLASVSEYGRVRVWDVATMRQRYHFPDEIPKDTRPNNLMFAPDGKLLAYSYFCTTNGGGQRGIRLLDAATGEERENLTIPNAVLGWFDNFGFSSDGNHLLGRTSNGEIYGWQRKEGRYRAKGLLGRDDEFGGSTAFTDDGFFSVNVFTGKVGPLRDLESGQRKRPMSEFPLLGGVLALSHDGLYLASAAHFLRGGNPPPQARHEILHVCEMATGKEVLHWRLPAHTWCNALTFTPDGRTLIAGMSDTTVLFWQLHPVAKESKQDGSVLWTHLADPDAAKAYRAVSHLSADPENTVKLLHAHLKPVEGVEKKRIEQTLAVLDDDAFAVREKAVKQLTKWGELAEPALRRTLSGQPTLEMRRRIEGLLKEIGDKAWQLTPEQLRQVRAVEVLERIGTGEALALLKTLAGGAEGARLTCAATAAARRLQTHSLRTP